MKNYAITRIKKHASVKSASYLVNHHLRLAEVANADPQKAKKNETLFQVPDIQAFLNDVPKGTKKNACRFVDVLFTASRFDTKQQFEDWKKASWEFAKKTFHLIEQEVKNVSLWDRFNPTKLHQRVRAHLVTAYSSAKKILLAKQVLETEKTNHKNQELLVQISAVKDKLEMVTGMENPTYVDLEKFRAKIRVLEPTPAERDPKEGAPAPQPPKNSPLRGLGGEANQVARPKI